VNAFATGVPQTGGGVPPELLPLDDPDELPLDDPDELPLEDPDELPLDDPDELPLDDPEEPPLDDPEELPLDDPDPLEAPESSEPGPPEPSELAQAQYKPAVSPATSEQLTTEPTLIIRLRALVRLDERFCESMGPRNPWLNVLKLSPRATRHAGADDGRGIQCRPYATVLTHSRRTVWRSFAETSQKRQARSLRHGGPHPAVAATAAASLPPRARMVRVIGAEMAWGDLSAIHLIAHARRPTG
jgi:hypothetical protein